MERLALYILGSPRIQINGHPIEVDTRKAIALLVYLAVTNDRPSRDALATLLWPDYDQSSARAALRRTLSVLNKALGEGCLDIRRESVEILPDLNPWVDVIEFRKLLASQGEHGHPSTAVCSRCVEELKKAVELYRDDFLTGFGLRDSSNFDEWQFFQSESLRRELAQALQRLVQGISQTGDFETGIYYARRWLSLDPLLEEAHRQLMLLYSWANHRNAALRQYRECVRVLDQELGVAPLQETTTLYQSILEHHPPAAPLGESFPTIEAVHHISSSLLESSTASPSTYPFVGRQAQLQYLQEQFRKKGSTGYWIVLSGEIGIGKTRLAEEFLSWAHSQGAVVIRARCYEGESSLAFGPLIEGLNSILSQPERQTAIAQIPPYELSEAARLLPNLHTAFPGLPMTSPIDSPGAQSRFFEGLRQFITIACAGRQPGILFLDDLQWADTATLDLLVYLVRRLNGDPLLILSTYRQDPNGLTERVQQLITEAQRANHAESILLQRLKPADIEELVRAASAMGMLPPDDFANKLYQETEGLPFFAVEYLESLVKSDQGQSDVAWDLPRTVRDVLRTRLASVRESAWQILSTAAVIGRSFDFNTLCASSGRSELEVITGLEALVAHGLIEEQRAGSILSENILYDFTHDKVRSLVYEETSLTRRRLLHRRVADAMVSLRRPYRDGSPFDSTIANHYHLSGQNLLAAEYYKLAGENARRLFANIEALSHFEAALADGYPAPALLHEAIGDLHTLLGEYAAAVTSYETAAALSKKENLAGIEHKLGLIHHRRGEWDLSISHFKAAQEAFGEMAPAAVRARLAGDWSRTAHHQGQTTQAAALARQALQLAEESQDSLSLAQSHNILGVLARNQGDLDTARYHLEKSLEYARLAGDDLAQAAPLNNLAQVYAQAGDPETGISFSQQALEIYLRQGDRHREAALRNNLADLYYASGCAEEAMEQLKQAVVIFAEIGVEAGQLMPEIWMLTEW